MIAPALRRLLRLPLLGLLLAGGLLTLRLVFPLLRETARRAAISRWSAMAVWCTGLRVVQRVEPGAPALQTMPAGAMLVANHISWVDIFAINALCPVHFVAKSELAGWPVLGQLATRVGTLFIERGKRHAVHRMIGHVAQALDGGMRVGVFPEGTTGDGLRLLPFHGNILQSAVVARATVVPVGLRYRDHRGLASETIEYVGDTSFATSMWRLTGAPRQTCEVHPLAWFDADGLTRHECAQRAREAISARLALPLEDTLPETLRDLRVAPR